MTTAINPTSQPHIQAMENKGNSNTSLFGRINLNWEKVLLFVNSALIITGIAVTFFMKLPIAMLGLGAYGVLYFYLHSKVHRERAEEIKQEIEELSNQVEDKQQRLKKMEENIIKLKVQQKNLTKEVKNEVEIKTKAIKYDRVTNFIQTEAPKYANRSKEKTVLQQLWKQAIDPLVTI